MKQSKIFNAGQIIALQSGQMTMFSELVNKKYANTDVQWKELHSGKTKILVEMQNDVPPPVVDEITGSRTSHLKAYREIQFPYAIGHVIYIREKAYQAGTYYTSSFDESGELETCFFPKGPLLYTAENNQPESCKVISAGQMRGSQARQYIRITNCQSLPTQNVDTDALQGMGFAGTLGFGPIWYEHHKEEHIARFGQESWDRNDWIHIFTFEKTEPLVSK